ncbi:hypothetical protein ASD21_00550 [Caulobacter sp. Root1455]|uniref:hypothetical protein n=1 Tax=Caulobacter sp. Root1455 TaxID=1736465 RepID=UPI0006FC0BC7|nr:hypothetical protein [Caulobacter sp. Root1455]KQZ06167.1 hypothetical protein ASD21_00550 [Caulobacter sp. Root1455]
MKAVAEHVIAREHRLLFGLTPFDDESFYGFAARLAAWNHFDSRHQFLLSMAFPHLSGGGLQAALEDRGQLAWRLRLSDEQLSRLTGRHDPELDRYRALVSLTARRVSPAALRKTTYHRAGWALQLPFCPESWEIFIDLCPACKRHLGWSKVLAIELCDHCGFDLRAAETTAVPKRQQAPLALMVGLVHRDPALRLSPSLTLPPHLADCSPFEVFELAMVFARATALMRSRLKLTMSSPIKKTAYMAAGMDIICRYPRSFDELMGGGNEALPKFFRTVRAYGGNSIGIYQRLFSDWEPCPHGPSRLRQKREVGGQLTLRQAAQQLRLENRDLRKLIDAGLIGAPKGRGVVRKCQWLDPGEVNSCVRRLEDRMSLQEFSRAFRIPVRGVAQLVSLGVLPRNQDPIVRELHPTTQLNRSAAEEVVGRLLAIRRVPTPEVLVWPIEDVFHGVGCQEKPWGPMLRAALDRQIPLYCDGDVSTALHIGKLQISQTLAWEILARDHPDLLEVPDLALEELSDAPMSRVEVESYLNCFPRDLSWLLAEGHLSKGLLPQEVAVLGQSIISSREISWRWRVSPALREALAKKHGIGRALGPFWPRAAVEEYFAARFPFGRPM